MDADSFSRVAKIFADSGEAETVERAREMLSEYGLRVRLSPAVAWSPSLQIIALTVINAASRTFLGNVVVEAEHDFPLRTVALAGRMVSQFCAWAGVNSGITGKAHWPQIHVGAHTAATRDDNALLPWARGWSFGLGPRDGREEDAFVPACVAAGGLAVGEAFSLLRNDSPYAGNRTLNISLWDGSSGGRDVVGATNFQVPGAWIVGLGHLGQAYAWTLGFMNPAEGATLVLQDMDTVTKSTLSTSMLSNATDIGSRKTRVAASWLESSGFETMIVERRFDENQRVAAMEPREALFGVDNAATRRLMEGAGFSRVIDGGLGGGVSDFSAIRLRTFPGPSKASAIWAREELAAILGNAPAYRAMLAKGADPCGVTTLATRSVGAPFVGCVAAGFVVAEWLRRHCGGASFAVVDLNLRDLARIQAVSM